MSSTEGVVVTPTVNSVSGLTVRYRRRSHEWFIQRKTRAAGGMSRARYGPSFWIDSTVHRGMPISRTWAGTAEIRYFQKTSGGHDESVGTFGDVFDRPGVAWDGDHVCWGVSRNVPRSSFCQDAILMGNCFGPNQIRG